MTGQFWLGFVLGLSCMFLIAGIVIFAALVDIAKGIWR